MGDCVCLLLSRPPSEWEDGDPEGGKPELAGGQGCDEGTWGRSRLSLHRSHPAGTLLTPPGLHSRASGVAKGRELDPSCIAGGRGVVGGKLVDVPWEAAARR